MLTRAVGIALGFAADRVFGDPRRFHPVAGFGQLAGRLRERWWADSRGPGVRYTGVLVGGAIGLGALIEQASRRHRYVHVAATALATWAVLGGRSLEREGMAVHAFLVADDLPGARQRLTHLVSRDTSHLTEEQIARAVVESIAENTSDAVVAPLVWGAVAGVPGLLGYRAANTLDAMVGYQNARYLNFGWASARLDDLLNLPGSRLTGSCVLFARPGTAGAALRAWRRDASAHPSPNAGVVESTFAAALGLQLGGTNTYGVGPEAVVEHRARMGRGRPPGAADIAGAARLARRVGVLAVGLTCVAAVARRR